MDPLVRYILPQADSIWRHAGREEEEARTRMANLMEMAPKSSVWKIMQPSGAMYTILIMKAQAEAWISGSDDVCSQMSAFSSLE